MHFATYQTPPLTYYRYTGKEPNNYVYFGCSNNCTQENLYQIIGVIPTQISETGPYENRVKLVKMNEYVGINAETSTGTLNGKGYRWNTTASNTWENGSLKTELNTNYLEILGSYQEYIEKTKWYLGSPSILSQENFTTEDFYKFERSNTKGYSQGALFHIDKIGLMYPSDYGYSIMKQYWLNAIDNNKENYKNNSWLFLASDNWLISPESTLYTADGPQAWVLKLDGSITHTFVMNRILGVRPTFYLKTDILYKSGDGSKTDPFQITLK